MMVKLKDPQGTVFRCPARFRVLVAGRRFGKTYLAAVELCRAAWRPGRLAWYVAPTLKQGKRIAWRLLKELTREYWVARPNETDLRIELVTGGVICVRGADNYDSLRGDGLDFLVLDEYASMAPQAWREVLRPALADRQGRALFIGTPHGFNHFYNLYQKAKDKPHWARFQFTTEQGGNVSRAELEEASHELDTRTYNQEFHAQFESLTSGRVYHAFDEQENVKQQTYDPDQPIFWSLDFNRNPASSIIGQRDRECVGILKELFLPDSHTWAACEEFLTSTRGWCELAQFDLVRRAKKPLEVYIYGDPAGDQQHSSAVRTDWQIVKDFFGRHPELYRPVYRVRGSHPPVKDRVNCVNARLCNHAGDRNLKVDPSCKQLIEDFRQVHWKTDADGVSTFELDKRSDPRRTHLSDALGYMIHAEFGMRAKAGEMPGFIG